MRRIALVFSMALGLASPALGQSPYPYYGPAPMPYAPVAHGYPVPMPNPMMARPMPYPPPMYAPWPVQPVMVLGPLDRPMQAPIRQTQAEQIILPVPSKRDLPPEEYVSDDVGDHCGPEGCPPEQCGPDRCGKITWVFPVRGKGHFIGEIGAYFLVPYPASNTAFNFANGGATGTGDFPRQLDIGPRASVGYITHTGWGVRGNYWWLNGSISTSTGNPPGSGSTIATPTDGFTIVSPSAALLQGVGVDQFRFTQNLELHVADIEAVKQFSFLDTTFLGSLGGRYVRIDQGYAASRNNPGGFTATQTIALDQENLSTSSYFQGWGPTVSLEAVHPLACGFSLYGNARGSFLFGNERFRQDYSQQNRTVTTAGAPTFTDASNTSVNYDTRVVSIFEAEAGIQYGCTIHRCYYFARAGAVYQRWWDVGSPTSSSGDLTFVGGTVRVGVSY